MMAGTAEAAIINANAVMAVRVRTVLKPIQSDPALPATCAEGAAA
jgi:hypothetical protein